MNEIQAIIHTLQNEIEARKKIVDTLEDSASYWEKERAYAWIHATPHPNNQVAPPSFQVPPFYQQSALTFYNDWMEKELDIQIFPRYIIPVPPNTESLIDYLRRLHTTVVKAKEKRTIWRKSLSRFLYFLRTQLPLSLQGHLDILFPKKMKFSSDIIIQRTIVTLKPIDIFITEDILQNLAYTALEGRPNARKSAIQTLGFAWLSLACSYSKAITNYPILYNLRSNALKNNVIQIETLFGFVEIPLSPLLFHYLKTLSCENGSRLFSMPLETLHRTFHRIVACSSKAQNIGPISFQTLLQGPHEMIGYR
nr:hypothetical protein 2 [bacterium]